MGGRVYRNKAFLLSYHWKQCGKTPDTSRRGVLLGHCPNRLFSGCPRALLSRESLLAWPDAPSQSPAASLPDHAMAAAVTEWLFSKALSQLPALLWVPVPLKYSSVCSTGDTKLL